MATFVSIVQDVQIVDGGKTIVDQSHTLENYEVDTYLEIPLRLPPGGDVTLDIANTPLINSWESINGFAGEIESPAYCELTFLAAGAEPVQVGPGPFCVSRTEAAYIKIENTSSVTANGKIVLFGRLS